MMVQVLIGAALLSFGRRLFWLFVGGIGFMVGVSLATRFLGEQSEPMILLIGILAGFIGAGLAIFLQKFAIGLAGFLAGGYLLVAMLNIFGIAFGSLDWILYIVGGIIGAALVNNLFEWALILLSSLSGAAMIAQGLQLEDQLKIVIAVSAFLIGVFIQTRTMGDQENESD